MQTLLDLNSNLNNEAIVNYATNYLPFFFQLNTSTFKNNNENFYNLFSLISTQTTPANSLLVKSLNLIQINFNNLNSNNKNFTDFILFNELNSSNLFAGFYPFMEIVFNLTQLSYNYTGVFFSSFLVFIVFFLFFFFFFTLFFPTPLHLFSKEIFLFSPESSYGFVEAEKEVGPVDDLLLPLIAVLVASVSWFFLLFPLQILNSFSSFVDSLILLFFCCIIVSLPINLLYECGFFFSTFFRGSAGSTSTMMELVYDLIANTTMFARMQVQHVRVLLGLAMYIETTNYIETLSINQLVNFNAENN